MCQRRSCSPTILWILALLVALGLAVSAQTPAQGEPLAEMDVQVITAEEVEKVLRVPLARLQELIYTEG
jgi:hypothetical protein